MHGVPVLLRCGDPGAARELRRDFARFVSSSKLHRPLRLEVSVGKPSEPPGVSWRGKDGAPYTLCDRGRRRFINYQDEGLASYDYAERKGAIVAESRDLAHELAHFAVLSRAGEELDIRGLHRAHALGFALGRSGALLLGPSGCGKSTIALAMLRSTRLRILSDDTPLIGRGLKLLPFPLRLSLRPSERMDGVPSRFLFRFQRRLYPPKLLVDWEAFEGRIAPSSALKLIFVARGKPEGRTPKVKPCPAPAAFRALFVHLVLGTEVPQMAEYLLNFRGKRFFRLSSIFLMRLKTALGAAARVPAFYFFPARDPEANAMFLGNMLAGRR